MTSVPNANAGRTGSRDTEAKRAPRGHHRRSVPPRPSGRPGAPTALRAAARRARAAAHRGALEAGGWVFRDGGEVGVALGDGEGEDAGHSSVRGFEPVGECFVIDQAGELEDEVVVDRQAGEVDRHSLDRRERMFGLQVAVAAVPAEDGAVADALDESVAACQVLGPRGRLGVGPRRGACRGGQRNPPFQRGHSTSASLRGSAILPPELRHARDLPVLAAAETARSAEDMA